MNLPNKLTLLRICLIPLCLLLWALGFPIPAAIAFAVAAITDFFDGYIARKQNIVTVFGKFADPVADKVLVLTAMVFLCADGHLPAWAVSIVAARELLVDGLRLVGQNQNQPAILLRGRRHGAAQGPLADPHLHHPHGHHDRLERRAVCVGPPGNLQKRRDVNPVFSQFSP